MLDDGYRRWLAVRNGFPSFTDYQQALEVWRSQKPAYRLLGKVLSNYLKDGGSVPELAEELEVSQSTVRRYAKGKSFPPAYRLDKMMVVVGAPKNQLHRLLSLYFKRR